MEGEKLTLEQINLLAPEEKAAKLVEIYQQEVDYRKKLEQGQEQGVQKLLDEQKYQTLLRTEKNKLLQDASYFEELMGKDESLAKEVLNEYFPGITIEEAIAQSEKAKAELEAEKETKPTKTSREEALEVWNEKIVNKNMSDFISKANLKPEEKALFDKEFADITEGKKLTEANIDKYLRLAFKEALPDIDYRKQEKAALDMAVGLGGGGGKGNEVDSSVTRASHIEYLKKVGIIR